MRTAPSYTIKRSDAVGLWIFMVIGAAIAVWTGIAASQRIMEVLPNTDVAVLGQFAGTVGSAPIGVDGAPVDVELEQAMLTVPTLPVAALWAIIIQQVVVVVTVLTVVVALVWLGRNVTRSIVFSRTNTVLVSTAGIVGLLGYAAVPFLGNMAANGAFAVLSERTFDNVIISVEPFSLVLLAFVAALMSTVFAIGERLQRDTDGLV
ncbi:MAG: hypothetical protein ABWY30_07860 [Microterricola sp.]